MHDNKFQTNKYTPCFVLIYHRGYSGRLLHTVIEESKEKSEKAFIYTSQQKFLYQWNLGIPFSTSKSTSLSLAIMPYEFVGSLPWVATVFTEVFAKNQIIFSVMGGENISVLDLLEKGALWINPDYQNFIQSLITSPEKSAEPVKAIMSKLMPYDYPNNMSACKNFITKLFRYNNSIHDNLDASLSALREKVRDRNHRAEIDRQLKEVLPRCTIFSQSQKPNISLRTTIIEYLGSNIPGFSKS